MSTPDNIKNDLDGNLYNRDAAAKQFRKTEKNIKKQMKALKKKNKFFLMAQNNSSLQDLCKVQKIKTSYDSSRSNISESSDYE